MFTGACAGSTSGGAKIDRIVVLFKFIKNEFYKLMHPNNVTTVSINGKGTSYIMVQKVLAFLCLYVIVIFVGGTLLTICGLPLKESFFYCLSCISNTGISTEIIGVGGGFASIPDIAKWILSAIMLIGRLELYTVLLIFTPIFWEK
jgi:trk system potassium uptake protein TrkH